MKGDFTWAVAQMKSGKKIIRGEHNTNRYLYIDTPAGDWCKYIKSYKNDDPNTKGDICSVSIKMIEATDWKIYDEEYNWNLTGKKFVPIIIIEKKVDSTCSSPTPDESYSYIKECYTVEDVETLKQKILDDLNELMVNSNIDKTSNIVDMTYNDSRLDEAVLMCKGIVIRRFGDKK